MVDHTRDLDIEFSWSYLEIVSQKCKGWLEWKGYESIGSLTHYVTLTFDLVPGIARLSDVYVPFPYIAPILCALLCEKEKNG